MAFAAILERPSPSVWESFFREPCLFLATTLYKWRQVILVQSIHPVAIVYISDAHNSQALILSGDILVHAGDLTQGGSFKESQQQLDWMNSLLHVHKIVVAGNHDSLLDTDHRVFVLVTRDTIS